LQPQIKIYSWEILYLFINKIEKSDRLTGVRPGECQWKAGRVLKHEHRGACEERWLTRLKYDERLRQRAQRGAERGSKHPRKSRGFPLQKAINFTLHRWMWGTFKFSPFFCFLFFFLILRDLTFSLLTICCLRGSIVCDGEKGENLLVYVMAMAMVLWLTRVCRMVGWVLWGEILWLGNGEGVSMRENYILEIVMKIII
jgi:hypothetical protein